MTTTLLSAPPADFQAFLRPRSERRVVQVRKAFFFACQKSNTYVVCVPSKMSRCLMGKKPIIREFQTTV